MRILVDYGLMFYFEISKIVLRKTLWDVPPPGYEDITPVKYKALRGIYFLSFFMMIM